MPKTFIEGDTQFNVGGKVVSGREQVAPTSVFNQGDQKVGNQTNVVRETGENLPKDTVFNQTGQTVLGKKVLIVNGERIPETDPRYETEMEKLKQNGTFVS